MTHLEYDEIIPIVFLRELQTWGKVVTLLPHMSLIEYELNGETYQEWFDGEDYILMENILFKHEEWG